MNTGFWDSLPPGFLKIGFKRWCKLDWRVKQLVVELSAKQQFKCALCKRTRGLIIEHDHDPEEGRGDIPTAFNIRGLTCQRCNWHLRVYEAEENGEHWYWENLNCHIYRHQYETYDFAYRCRVRPLIEAALEKRMGSGNYWRRRNFLEKFDAWYYDGERSIWRDRWKREQALKIKTPEQFVNGMLAILKFVSGQMDKDPNYQPPDQFIELALKARQFAQDVLASRSVVTGHPRAAPVAS